MRVDHSPYRLWLPAVAMFVLSLVVTVADRMEMLSGTRSALHDAFSPGRLALIAMQATVTAAKRQTKRRCLRPRRRLMPAMHGS